MSNDVSKSWFSVLNNPEEHGYTGTPQEICDRLADEWCSVSPTRSGAWLYCVSADGLHHIHMVLEDSIAMRFSVIKKSYACGMHFEATKGNKQQVEDYINKRGKFEEKGEIIVCSTIRGEIKGCQGKRNDLDDLGDFIEQGFTPSEILSMNPAYYRYETYIRRMFFDKRSKETPPVRDVEVIWCMGESGSGKSYHRMKLIEEYGEDAIYYLTDYSSGGFDGYNGQSILWMEDFRGEMKFGDLLRITDRYKADVHCRYTNAKALWTKIYITSTMHPKEVYRHMVEVDAQGKDKVEQLLRRITCIRYFWKDENGCYHYADFLVDTTVEEMRSYANSVDILED